MRRGVNSPAAGKPRRKVRRHPHIALVIDVRCQVGRVVEEGFVCESFRSCCLGLYRVTPFTTLFAAIVSSKEVSLLLGLEVGLESQVAQP